MSDGAQLSMGFEPSSAMLSPCGLYRYKLTRRWAPTGPTVCWVMLNPSTADAESNDPTIRRCIGFSRDWGFAGLVVVNLFAWRATKPKALLKAADPVGPENDEAIGSAARGSDQIILAWGANAKGRLWPRAAKVRALLLARQPGDPVVYHLGLTKDGEPNHPLMLHSLTERVLCS